jgi:DNA-binding CsgD family transcriptional regulator
MIFLRRNLWQSHSPKPHAVAYLSVVNFSEWNAPVTNCVQLVGRGEEAAIRLPDRFRSVSRRHASVWADPQRRLWLCDLGSRLGTAVNRVPLTPDQPTAIVVGDRVRLGMAELELVASGPLAAEIAAMQSPRVDETRSEGCSAPPHGLAAQVQSLTPAELAIVLWMTRGYTSLKAIGRKLHRSPHTVRTQLCSVFRKVGVHSRDELLGCLHRGSPINEHESNDLEPDDQPSS